MPAINMKNDTIGLKSNNTYLFIHIENTNATSPPIAAPCALIFHFILIKADVIAEIPPPIINPTIQFGAFIRDRYTIVIEYNTIIKM